MSIEQAVYAASTDFSISLQVVTTFNLCTYCTELHGDCHHAHCRAFVTSIAVWAATNQVLSVRSHMHLYSSGLACTHLQQQPCNICQVQTYMFKHVFAQQEQRQACD